MRVLSVLAGIVLAASIVSAQDQPKPTVKQCQANLKQWVPMFKAAYDDPACAGDGSTSCPFAAPIRDLDIGQLVHLPFEAERCAKTDKRRRYSYERVAARAENIVIMRTGYFLKSENQMDSYVEWERSQRQASNPINKPTNEDDPATVAKKQ